MADAFKKCGSTTNTECWEKEYNEGALGGLFGRGSSYEQNRDNIVAALKALGLDPGVTPRPIASTPPTPAPTVRPLVGFPASVAAVVENVASPISIAVNALAIASALLTALSAFGALPASLLQAFMPFLAARRRQPPWGRVVELGTNLPIAGAVVTILDKDGKPRHTVQSKADGTFGALLPKGTYSFDVRKAEFALVTDPQAPAALFPDERLYGGPFEVKSEEEVVPVLVLLKPLTARARRTDVRAELRFWWERLRILQARLAIPILLVGAAINSIVLLQKPTPLLISFEILYAVLFVFELAVSRVVKRALGRVRDALKRAPVPLAIVRLVDASNRRLVATRVTSPSGTFLLTPPPGKYLLQVIHTAYVPYTDARFNVGKGVLAGSVRVKVDLEPRQNR